MHQRVLFILGGTLIVAVGIGLAVRRPSTPTIHPSNAGTTTTNQNVNAEVNQNTPLTNTAPPLKTDTSPELKVVAPMSGFFDRITKKPFGIYITKANSPVSPERFHGYHSGADAEATVEEGDGKTPIYAVADGTVVAVRTLDGYGGVMLVRHTVGSETVTGLYGHIRLSSVSVKVGDQVSRGQQIAVLGRGYSSETDFERPHLHFAVIKGTSLTYKGYVQSKSELSAWHDPVAWLHQQGL